MPTINDTLMPGPGAILEAETYEAVAAQAVTLTHPRSLAAEQYRVLRHRLEMLAKQGHKALARLLAVGTRQVSVTPLDVSRWRRSVLPAALLRCCRWRSIRRR